MNYYRSTIEKLIHNFYKERTLSHLNEYFFLSSHLHFALTLEIVRANYINKEISVEDLYAKIPKIFGSRSTIKTILRQGVNSNFFSKNTSLKDKRIKIYNLNKKSKIALELWIENRKNLYDNKFY